jgi:hypothetical protein
VDARDEAKADAPPTDAEPARDVPLEAGVNPRARTPASTCGAASALTDAELARAPPPEAGDDPVARGGSVLAAISCAARSASAATVTLP